MNCGEYRNAFNCWLDGGKSSPVAAGADLHARSCARCGSYSRAMIRIDYCLRNLPEISVPVEFLGTPREGEAREVVRRAAFPFRVAGGIACGLPPAFAWILSGLLPAPADTAAQFLLVSAALALLTFTVLRPGLSA